MVNSTPSQPSVNWASARRAWCWYDWANSAFATTVMAALFPPFFTSLARAAGAQPAEATAWWGYITAGTLFVIALSAPVLGILADMNGARKRFLGFFAAMGILATAMMTTLGEDTWRAAATLYVLANFGFSGSFIFYESLLPQLASGLAMDRLSSRAYALGYAGGGLLLVINLMMVTKPDWFGFPSTAWAVRASFATVALWWGFFSIPLFRKVPEPARGQSSGAAQGSPLVTAFLRLSKTFREIRRYRQLTIFLAAYWIYNDGIGTIVKMATAYGAEIGIGMTDLMGALVLTQVVGIPCALLFGRLAGSLGVRGAILLALAVYGLISVGGFFLSSPLHFYILAGLVGMVQGGAQALSRSLFASMVPRHRTAEFFGFYSTSGKLAGVAGPLIFGMIGQLTGTSRLGILSLVVFFMLGGWLLTKVNVEAGRQEARRSELDSGVAFSETRGF
jgi:MFS transporter, UMF1 family